MMTSNAQGGVDIRLKRIAVVMAGLLFAITMLMLGITNLMQSNDVPDVDAPDVVEYELRPITLTGDASDANREHSGMAWYNEALYLLPQYPQGVVYRIPADELRAYLVGDVESITPATVPFVDDNVATQTGRFEGYEAIVFDGDVVYVTIEARDGGTMTSYLVEGRISAEGIVLDANSVRNIPQPANISNSAHEALVILNGMPTAIYERNAPAENAIAQRLNEDGETWQSIAMPPMFYRITDASEAEFGAFWVINYNFDDANQADQDALVSAFGIGESHRQYTHVERLLEMQFVDDRIQLTNSAPVYLALDDAARNWEGLVRFDDGWLVITDKFPSTLLAYVIPLES
jgi:hypothetical protein